MAVSGAPTPSPAMQTTMGLLKLLQTRASHPMAPPPDQAELGHLRGLVNALVQSGGHRSDVAQGRLQELYQNAQTHDPGAEHVTDLGQRLHDRFGLSAGGTHPLWEAWNRIFNGGVPPVAPPGVPTPQPGPYPMGPPGIPQPRPVPPYPMLPGTGAALPPGWRY